MLPKKNRLSRKDFSQVLASRQVSNTQNFFLRVGKSGSGTKIAVSVSKKVSKNAVDRNTLRRRVYALIKKFFPKLKSGSYLILAKPSAKGLGGERLENELSRLLLS